MGLPEYPGKRRPGFTASSLDRQSHWRVEPQRLDALLDQAQIILLHRYKVPVSNGHAQLLPARNFADRLDDAIWLGMWQDRSLYALSIDDTGAAAHPELQFRDLRGSTLHLDADHASVLAYARAMLYWQRQHLHCGRCGSATRPGQAGHVRVCPDCEREHYPRSDPSMLVLVSDEQDRALLGRQHSWPKGFWSGLAGFVEPGESIEDAVIREVWEEARIEVTGMRYLASQPWPFPASILMGYLAKGKGVEPEVEQDDLEAAGWFSRSQITQRLQSGEMYLPPRFTLSYRLIEAWFDAGSDTPLSRLCDGNSRSRPG